MNAVIGQLVLALHLGVIGFNVAGLAVIPLGASFGWRFVRIRWLGCCTWLRWRWWRCRRRWAGPAS